METLPVVVPIVETAGTPRRRTGRPAGAEPLGCLSTDLRRRVDRARRVFRALAMSFLVLAASATVSDAATENLDCGVLAPGQYCVMPGSVTTADLGLYIKYDGTSPQLRVCGYLALNSTFSNLYTWANGYAWSAHSVYLEVNTSHTYYVRVQNCDSSNHTVKGTVLY